MNKVKKHWPGRISIIISGFIGFTIFLYSCNTTPAPPTLQSHIANGQLLAKKYCISCHQLPDPSLIDRASWRNGVLPAMAKNLGIQNYMGQYYADAKSAIGTSDWQDIVTYYTQTAPVNLIIPKPAVAPLKDWATFELQRPPNVNPEAPGMTTMLTIDSVNHQLYSADVANNLYKWTAGLKPELIHQFDSPVTDLKLSKDQAAAIVTCIGNMAPVNQYKGKIYLLNGAQNDKKTPFSIADSLPRPVQTVAADFNKDGLTDYVTCGFGHDNGGLYCLKQQPDHSYKKTVIRAIPGGEQLITGDFNHDGWPDIMCLFAQADEGIWMFLNDHKGGFLTQNLLHFPSVYGSSSFQLVDFNHDGKPDLLYTCGDNSDYSKVLKPYHGVYIFTNLGNWKFKQTYFYHIDGCTKAIAADFKHNGKLDIAAIAFFSDFKFHPQESFTYLEGTGANRFTAHEIPVNQYGRWLTMAVGDINNDGKDDIRIRKFFCSGPRALEPAGF